MPPGTTTPRVKREQLYYYPLFQLSAQSHAFVALGKSKPLIWNRVYPGTRMTSYAYNENTMTQLTIYEEQFLTPFWTFGKLFENMT